MNALHDSSDPYDLKRFVKVQDGTYATALAEIRGSRKRSHWMWFVFPQVAGLGFSGMSQRYTTGSAAEARAYLLHPLLGPRLVECVEAVLKVQGRSANAIFGSPDDLKLRSCASGNAHVRREPFAKRVLFAKGVEFRVPVRSARRSAVAITANG